MPPRLTRATSGAASVPAEAAAAPTGEKLPVPMAAIFHSLKTQREKAGAAATGADTGSSAFLEVEVETKQGYVYSGKLIDIDAHYNLTIAEAVSRRERACDVERQLLHSRCLNMGGMDEAAMLETAERVDSATRTRFLGTTYIRSHNLFMIRFRQDATTTASGAAQASTAAEKKMKSQPAQGGVTNPRDMRSAFKAMAVAVKKSIMNERTRKRAERRKRISEASKAVKK